MRAKKQILVVGGAEWLGEVRATLRNYSGGGVGSDYKVWEAPTEDVALAGLNRWAYHAIVYQHGQEHGEDFWHEHAPHTPALPIAENEPMAAFLEMLRIRTARKRWLKKGWRLTALVVA